MSRKGDCWGNTVAESLFKTIKNEWLNRFRFSSCEQLHQSIENCVNWYKTPKIHSALDYLTPLEMEIKLRNSINKAV